MILASFIKDPTKTRYDGEDHDEHIKYVLRRGSITNLPWMLLTVLLLAGSIYAKIYLANAQYKGQQLFDDKFIATFILFWHLATFGYFFVNFLLWFFNVYIVTNKKIVDVDFHGLLYKNISEATLDNIEDVTSTVRGVFGVVFNIGDVYIQTAAEKREFEFTKVYNPAGVRDLIADLVENVRARIGRREGEIILRED